MRESSPLGRVCGGLREGGLGAAGSCALREPSSGEQMLLLHGVSPAPLSDEASASADKGLTVNEGRVHCPEQPSGN